MPRTNGDRRLELDINHPVFLEDLLTMQKAERHSAMETLNRLRQMSWNQVYADQGLKWEKILSVAPPAGVNANYSLRITQSRRAVAYRDGNNLRFLSIPSDHDSTYGKR
jgi:hypothetical protein